MSKKSPIEVANSLPARFMGGDSVEFTMPNGQKVAHVPGSLEKLAREAAGNAQYRAGAEAAKAEWMRDLYEELLNITHRIIREAR